MATRSRVSAFLLPGFTLGIGPPCKLIDLPQSTVPKNLKGTVWLFLAGFPRLVFPSSRKEVAVFMEK
ncbi:MAG: hypothetical protein GX989_02805 [Firmicutes bacterium]|nr:hypothetical protein [Bacillota bacterium]